MIDGYYKNGLDTHDVGEAVYRIAIDPKPKLRQSASCHLFYPCACGRKCSNGASLALATDICQRLSLAWGHVQLVCILTQAEHMQGCWCMGCKARVHAPGGDWRSNVLMLFCCSSNKRSLMVAQ